MSANLLKYLKVIGDIDKDTYNSILSYGSCINLFESHVYSSRFRIRPSSNVNVKLNIGDMKEYLRELKRELDSVDRILFIPTKMITESLYCQIRMILNMKLNEEISLYSTLRERILWGNELGLYNKNTVESYDDVHKLLFDITYDDVKPVVDEYVGDITLDSLIDEDYMNAFVTKASYVDSLYGGTNCTNVVVPSPYPKEVVVYRRPIYQIILNTTPLLLSLISNSEDNCDPKDMDKNIREYISSIVRLIINYNRSYSDIRTGEFFEPCLAIDLPTFKWTFYDEKTNRFFIAVPDGIGKDFVYEFKITKNENSKEMIRKVMSIQIGTYAYLFGKKKSVGEIFVLNRLNYYKKLFNKTNTVVFEEFIDRYEVELNEKLINFLNLVITVTENTYEKLRPMSDSYCLTCPDMIKSLCPYYSKSEKLKDLFENFSVSV